MTLKGMKRLLKNISVSLALITALANCASTGEIPRSSSGSLRARGVSVGLVSPASLMNHDDQLNALRLDLEFLKEGIEKIIQTEEIVESTALKQLMKQIQLRLLSARNTLSYLRTNMPDLDLRSEVSTLDELESLLRIIASRRESPLPFSRYRI